MQEAELVSVINRKLNQIAHSGTQFLSETMKGNTHMKFDIVRAWKDDMYRQNLTQEQLSMLPAHPAGELAEADLALVSGCGDGGFDDNGLGIVGSSAAASASSSKQRTHSFSGLI